MATNWRIDEFSILHFQHFYYVYSFRSSSTKQMNVCFIKNVYGDDDDDDQQRQRSNKYI